MTASVHTTVQCDYTEYWKYTGSVRCSARVSSSNVDLKQGSEDLKREAEESLNKFLALIKVAGWHLGQECGGGGEDLCPHHAKIRRIQGRIPKL